jgi:UDP-glucose 4-epimerase
MAKAIDMGNYFRIPCDSRNLNYDKYFVEGEEKIAQIEDYHSHNTRRLDLEGMKKELLRLEMIQEDIKTVVDLAQRCGEHKETRSIC